MGETFKELIKKIELQSVLVLVITLLAGCFLLNIDNSVSTPAGLLGSACIVFGILYTFVSFSSNQIKESYKDVINEYKTHISTLKSSSKFMSQFSGGQTAVSSGDNEAEYQVIGSGDKTKAS